LASEALTLREIDAYYGDSHVLRRVSLHLPEGRLLGLLGRNGAGKTTTLSVTVGLLPARHGAVEVYGRAVTGRTPEVIAAHGVALVPQGRRVFRNLTVQENLTVAGRRPRDGRAAPWTLDSVYGVFPRLSERHRQMAGSLSGGEQQMLAIARALMARPRLVLFDEPSLGLAPTIVETTFGIIADIRRRGTTVLMVEQNAYAALRMADRAYVMETGRIVLEGPARDLLEDDHVRRAYLGG
jgi:branched-chain amino acid transport system ATP-binding protein